jgi:hypothetical protein
MVGPLLLRQQKILKQRKQKEEGRDRRQNPHYPPHIPPPSLDFFRAKHSADP